MPDFNANKNYLVDLELNRVDFVSQGSNADAYITLFKRKENNEMPKTVEEILKALKEEDAQVLQTEFDALNQQISSVTEELQKAKEDLVTKDAELQEAQTEITKSRAPKEDNIEELLKSANPALAAHIQKLTETVNTFVEKDSKRIAEERFEAIKSIPVEAETLKEIVKSASPATYEVLKAAANAINEGLLKAKGSDITPEPEADDSKLAYATLEKSARHIAEEQNISFENAFIVACQSDPATYAKLQ